MTDRKWLEFCRICGQIPLNHQCNLKDDGVVKFPQVQTCQLLDLFQPVYQRIPVYKQLSGSFRNIQIIFKELLNGKQCFVIQRFNAAPLEHFVQESFTQGGRQVVNQACNAQIIVADNGFIRIEDLSDFQSGLCLLEGTGQFFDAVHNGFPSLWRPQPP